ncbi:MAG: peptide antibiotic transporter SbmA [Hyphomicrobiales bacterium]
MFKSFFPSPKTFFISAAAYALAAVLFWFFVWKGLGASLGWGLKDGETAVIGISVFWSKPFLWFYAYYAVIVAIFAAAWWFVHPHKYFLWSVLGTALIIFTTYYQVEVSVAINAWYGPFYDLIQASASKSRPTPMSEYIEQIWIFLTIACMAVVIGTLTRFFVSHYNFRWRQAMNDFYMGNWQRLRTVEGASQRVQDDAMRFTTTLEGLGVSFIDAIMTLIAFLPVLHALEGSISELPIIGASPYPLVIAAIIWSLFGTGLMAAIGIKLPGLEFRNQRVEATYRKELVYAEDDPTRAQPPTVAELFSQVRKNYFTLYFHYVYFNVGRILYLQVDNIFPIIVLLPTLVAQKITLGPMTQIQNSFDQVRNSFQFLINSWPTIISLISIYKRLRAFEATLEGKELGSIEQEAVNQPVG